jgi:hypothetical protein
MVEKPSSKHHYSQWYGDEIKINYNVDSEK